MKARDATVMPLGGIDSVVLPGAGDGWARLHESFGRLPWSDLFQPAIFYATNGYAVPELIHGYWEEAAPDLKKNPESVRVFLPNGRAPEVGEIFRNPDLAKALGLIATKGPREFYTGAI